MGGPQAPCSCVVAGCNGANNSARMILRDILERARLATLEAWPRQCAIDVQLCAGGRCSIFGRPIAASANAVVENCRRDRLPVSSKSTLMATARLSERRSASRRRRKA